jgi:hypothetical protein
MALGEFELLGERPAGSLIDLFQCSRPMHKSKIGGEGRYDHRETGKVTATLTATAHERDHPQAQRSHILPVSSIILSSILTYGFPVVMYWLSCLFPCGYQSKFSRLQVGSGKARRAF